ncbi:amidohydrolase family protein [Mariniblastus sp.]|nr:amidohydrolase family protein [Mariniblastus sp.]
MNKLSKIAAIILAVSLPFAAGPFVSGSIAQEIPGAPQQQPIVLKNATLHPVDSAKIDKGMLLIKNGKIAGIGKRVKIPKGAKTIDLKGKHIYPGLFEAHTQLGLTELSAVRATNDYRESGSINPNVKALVSVYPDNIIIPVTRSNGVLFALTAPTGGLISGKSAVIQLDGWTYEDMSVKAEAALQVNWPSQNLSPRRRAMMSAADANKAIKGQAEMLAKLTDFFESARNYRDARNAPNSTQNYDARLEAMIDVVDGKTPMMVKANGAAEIQSAVNFCLQEKVKLIILGGYDAAECASLLRKYDVPVVIGAIHRVPQRRSDEYDRAYTLAARLHKAGVKFCISGTERSKTWNARNLAYHAATAAAFGLPVEEAIRSITLSPAEIFGVDDKIGSLTVGKDASLIVTDGNPLEARTHVLQAFLQGREVDLSNRQLRLYKKYQERYKQLEAEQDK